MRTCRLLSTLTLLYVLTAQLLYPGRRACSWFEFMTDGLMPTPFANLAQNALATMWSDGFGRDCVRQKPVSDAMKGFLGNCKDSAIVELAAGIQGVGCSSSFDWTP